MLIRRLIASPTLLFLASLRLSGSLRPEGTGSRAIGGGPLLEGMNWDGRRKDDMAGRVVLYMDIDEIDKVDRLRVVHGG